VKVQGEASELEALQRVLGAQGTVRKEGWITKALETRDIARAIEDVRELASAFRILETSKPGKKRL
jgi:hypothetical protein